MDRKVISLSLSAENTIIGHQREHYQVFCGLKIKPVSLSDFLCLMCVYMQVNYFLIYNYLTV